MSVHQSPKWANPAQNAANDVSLPLESAGKRLDAWLAACHPEHSRNAWKQFIDAGLVSINGRPAPKSLVLQPGMRLDLDSQLRNGSKAEAPVLLTDPGLASRLKVIFRDEFMLVLDKPAGIPCHPLRASENGTVINGVAALVPGAAQAGPKPLEGGLVHRLDTQTSGLLLVALDRNSWEKLQASFRDHRAVKRYLAIVEGDLAGDRIIDWPIAHHAKDPKRMVAVRPGMDQGAGKNGWRGSPRTARSAIHVLKRMGGMTLLEVTVVQAQMHQIRVHLAALGHPLVADAIYGNCPAHGVERHALHAWKLSLPHPSSGELLELCAPLPDDVAHLLAAAGVSPPD